MTVSNSDINELKSYFFANDRPVILAEGTWLGIPKQNTPVDLPPSNTYFIYPKLDGVFYKFDEFGNETVLQGGAFITRLEDADCDTTVEVERTEDDDHVYFRAAGTDRLIVEPTGPISIPARTTGTITGLAIKAASATDTDINSLTFQNPAGTVNARIFSTPTTSATRIKSNGIIALHANNTTIDASNPDVVITAAGDVVINHTSAVAQLNIKGNTVNSDPASFAMGGTELDEGFYYKEVFEVSVSSQTEITRITGTGQNGFAGFVKVTVTGHTAAVGNGGLVNEYSFSITTVTTVRSLDIWGGNAPTLTLALASNVLTIDLTSNGGVNTFVGIMAVEYFIPPDFSGNTWTVS